MILFFFFQHVDLGYTKEGLHPDVQGTHEGREAGPLQPRRPLGRLWWRGGLRQDLGPHCWQAPP